MTGIDLNDEGWNQLRLNIQALDRDWMIEAALQWLIQCGASLSYLCEAETRAKNRSIEDHWKQIEEIIKDTNTMTDDGREVFIDRKGIYRVHLFPND